MLFHLVPFNILYAQYTYTVYTLPTVMTEGGYGSIVGSLGCWLDSCLALSESRIFVILPTVLLTLESETEALIFTFTCSLQKLGTAFIHNLHEQVHFSGSYTRTSSIGIKNWIMTKKLSNSVLKKRKNSPTTLDEYMQHGSAAPWMK